MDRNAYILNSNHIAAFRTTKLSEVDGPVTFNHLLHAGIRGGLYPLDGFHLKERSHDAGSSLLPDFEPLLYF